MAPSFLHLGPGAYCWNQQVGRPPPRTFLKKAAERSSPSRPLLSVLPVHRNRVPDYNPHITRTGFAIPKIFSKWWAEAQRIKGEAHVYLLVFKHPGTPWYAKLVAVCTAGYLLSPIQLIPNYIPVIGCLDDLLVLFLGAKLIQRLTPPAILADCRARVAQARALGKDKPKSIIGTIAFFAVAAIWLAIGIVGTAFLYSHLHR